MVNPGNKLIAEFMGHVVYDSNQDMEKVPLDELKPYYIARNLQYDTSWDWLFPVLEKIEDLECVRDVTITPNLNCVILVDGEVFEDVTGNTITTCFNTVLQFLEWYNKKDNKSDEEE